MLQARLVGELRLDLDGRRLAGIASGRARSLLAWLAYHPGLHSRTRVAAVFWPEVLESSARASLRTTLATLRREIGEAAFAHVVADRERVGVAEDVWVDVREAGRLTAQGRHEEALALSEGELLTDLDDDWVLEERHAHADRVAGLLTALGDGADAAGDLDAAVAFAQRRLRLDPVSEDAARALIARLARNGDRASAVAAYEAFRSALRRELGLAPSAETRALVERLREVAALPAPPLPAALARVEHAPLIGRREALAALLAAWRRASAGAAGVVMLAGEAGSGKTRLLSELAGLAHAEGATVLAGRCMEDHAVAFAPFTEALRPYATDALPAWVVAELARLLPELDPGGARAAGEAADARHRLFEAVAATVAHAAGAQPALLVVEDLHWADAATLGMLAHVIRTVLQAPLLVAGSLRDEGAAAAPALHALLGDLRRERRLETVALAGLSEAEAGDLAAAWLQAGVAPELAIAVHRRTGGNPLFVEELARHLAESLPGRSAQELIAAAAGDVPRGVRAVIDRRLARLPGPAATALRVAAVTGEDFALTEVAAACEAGEDDVADGLDAVVATRLIFETAAPGHYRFAHALVREAVLAGLTATRRALLHRRIAAVLEALPGEQRLPELARHLLDARPLVAADAAADMALRAADQATRRLAYEEAAELLERAADARLAGRPRAEVLLALGHARLRSGDAPAADRCFDAAAEEARSLADPELLARAALGTAGLAVTVALVREGVRARLEEALAVVAPDSPLRPRLLARLAIELYYARPASLRERVSAEALVAGRRDGGPALLEALGARHVALWSPDHTEERLAIADELIAQARACGEREAELQGLNWRVADLYELGEREALEAAVAAHERLADELRLPHYRWYVPLWRASLALLGGHVDEARRRSEQGAEIGRAAGDPNAQLLFVIQRLACQVAREEPSAENDAIRRRRAERSPAGHGWRTSLLASALVQGDVESARRGLERELAELASATLDANWLYTATGLGVLAARLGDERAAAELYPRLLPYGRRCVVIGRGAYCTGSTWLRLGLLAATLGERDAAIAHLEEAVRRDDAMGAVAYAAAARHALAELVGDPALAAEAAATAGAIGMTLPDGLVWRS